MNRQAEGAEDSEDSEDAEDAGKAEGSESAPAAANADQSTMSDEEWDRDERNETPTQRLDRNWNDLLQELRVVQTGVQLLTGFLLTLPFQQRFAELDDFERRLYLTTVASAVIATGLLIAPVMLHRMLFRRHARLIMVNGAHRLAMLGTAFLAVAIIGVVLLIFDIVAGRMAAITTAVVTGALLIGLWVAGPAALRLRIKSGSTGSIRD